MTKDNDTIFKGKIMRRIYMIYWFRRLRSSPTVYKAVGFFGLIGLNLTVNSTPDIFNNVNNVSRSNGWLAAGHYLFNSFVKSELGAQTALVAGGIIAAIVFKDVLNVARGKIHFPLALRFK